MSITPHLLRTLWDSGITQPDIIFNDALRLLDALVAGILKSRTTDAQPGSPEPVEGDAYIMTASASGTDWATFDEHDIAVYSGAAWIQYAPMGRVTFMVDDESDAFIFWDGAAWSLIQPNALTADWDAGAFDIRSLSSFQDAGAAAAAVVQRFGAAATEGYEIKVIDETLSGLSAISTDLTEDIPDGAVYLCVQGNIETAVVAGGTSVKVGIGPVGDPDKYGITSAFTKNLKIDTIPTHAVLSGAEDLQVNMCATGGGIGDTVASAGAVRVRVVYAVPNSLVDAA